MRTGLLLNTMVSKGQSAADLYTAMIEQAQVADEIGYDSIWLGEAHVDDAEPSPQSQTLLTTVAAATSMLRVGTASKVAALDNPIRIAEDVATMDLATNGRVVLGVAPGDDAAAFQRYNKEFSNREEVLKEYLDIIVNSWTCDGFKYVGEHYTYPMDAEPNASG